MYHQKSIEDNIKLVAALQIKNIHHKASAIATVVTNAFSYIRVNIV